MTHPYFGVFACTFTLVACGGAQGSADGGPDAATGDAPAGDAPAGDAGSINFPVRAAFYYPWFPETWGSLSSPFTNYHPTLGYYDTNQVVAQHVAAMQYAKISVGIASWWGQGSKTDGRLPNLLAAAAGNGFLWTVYYEPEGIGDPTSSQIQSDLEYIVTHYAGDPAFFHVAGRPVIFSYADGNDACAMVDRWKAGNTVNAYVVLKVFPGYLACANQPDGWHQYAPANATDQQKGFSYTVSPGFWKSGETTPRLARDPTGFASSVRAMIASGEPWQLVTTFDEWGEGTAVESAQEWATASGFGAYLDVLHNDGQ